MKLKWRKNDEFAQKGGNLEWTTSIPMGVLNVVDTWDSCLFEWVAFFISFLHCVDRKIDSPVLQNVCAEYKFEGQTKKMLNKLSLITKTKLFLFSTSEIYLLSLETPYFKFVRDTLSYIVLLVLHYALCLSPTTVTFSRLEWTILIFFIGRFLVERKQMADVLQHLKRERESGSQSKFIHLKALSIYQR